jgi:hypothetical protein
MVGRGSIPCRETVFLFVTTVTRPSLGLTRTPIQLVLGVKRPNREADHLPASRAEVKVCIRSCIRCLGKGETLSLGEIWGSHGDLYGDGCLLGCCAMQSGAYWLTFQRNFLPPSSGWSLGLYGSFSTGGTCATLFCATETPNWPPFWSCFRSTIRHAAEFRRSTRVVRRWAVAPALGCRSILTEMSNTLFSIRYLEWPSWTDLAIIYQPIITVQ